MSLEKYFEKEAFPDIDWEKFWKDVEKDYNSVAYTISLSNVSSSNGNRVI